MDEIFEQAWRGFHGDSWKEDIDLSNFIVRNFTEYKGDDTFLTAPSAKTQAVWSRCEKLLEEENKNGGCLDVETNILSGITAFAPGYIDKENEVIVGLQTDAPLKRIVNMYGGTKVAIKALESHGYKLNDEVYKHFTSYRKTHNDGVLMLTHQLSEELEAMVYLQVFLMVMEEVELLVTIEELLFMVLINLSNSKRKI